MNYEALLEFVTCRYCDIEDDLIICSKCGNPLCESHWKKYGACCLEQQKDVATESAAT